MQTNLLKPKQSNSTAGHNRAKVELEPFERGYGHTLGNAIRRVLLSSMVGYAATEVTIAGVCTSIRPSTAWEDVVNILLNLKGVVFKLHNRDEVTLSLRKDGEGVVTTRDIQTPHDVEIINPDHVIATCRPAASWTCRSRLRRVAATCPGTCAAMPTRPTKSIGRIVLDASFSPVKRVSYTVESARVEQRTDLDKLVVWRSKPTAPFRRRGRTRFGQDPGRATGRIRAARWRRDLRRSAAGFHILPAAPRLIRFCCVP